MLALNDVEEDTGSLIQRILPLLDEIDLKETLQPVTRSALSVVEKKDLPLVEISWKLAILLSQNRITQDEHLCIVDFYVTDYFDSKQE